MRHGFGRVGEVLPAVVAALFPVFFIPTLTDDYVLPCASLTVAGGCLLAGWASPRPAPASARSAGPPSRSPPRPSWPQCRRAKLDPVGSATLPACSSYSVSSSLCCQEAAGPSAREPTSAPPTRGRPAFSSSNPPQDQGSAPLAGGPEHLPGLEAPSHSGPTRNRPPLAPPRLAALLALALTPAAGPATTESRGSGADRHNGERELALGHRAYPQRTPQARRRGRLSVDPPLPPAAALCLRLDLAQALT